MLVEKRLHGCIDQVRAEYYYSTKKYPELVIAATIRAMQWPNKSCQLHSQADLRSSWSTLFLPFSRKPSHLNYHLTKSVLLVQQVDRLIHFDVKEEGQSASADALFAFDGQVWTCRYMDNTCTGV